MAAIRTQSLELMKSIRWLGVIGFVFGLVGTGCDSGGQDDARVEPNQRGEPSERLSALVDPETIPAPSYGNHVVPDEESHLYRLIPGNDVVKFKNYVKALIGLEIPETAGSFVGDAGRYYAWDRGIRNDPAVPSPDNFEQNTVAFMMPLGEVPGFVERLKACGERFEKGAPETDHRWSEGGDGRERINMTFKTSGQASVGDFFLPCGVRRQHLAIGVDTGVGVVFYRSYTEGDDDD